MLGSNKNVKNISCYYNVVNNTVSFVITNKPSYYYGIYYQLNNASKTQVDIEYIKT